jgi:hypothetical protein
MADLVTTGSTGISISADEISTGVFTQRVKIVHGPDNSGTDASTAAPFPITLLSTAATYITTAVPLGVKVGDGTTNWSIDVGGAARATLYTTSATAVAFNANGQATAANSAPVIQASNTSFAYSAAATFYSVTSASTYAANDAYGSTASANTTTVAAPFELDAPSAAKIMITSATLRIDTSATEATAWKLRLYSSLPTTTNTFDNAAFDIPSGDRSAYLGSINFGIPTDEGSTLFSEIDGVNKQLTLASTRVFGLLTNVSSSTAITTADHVVKLHAVSV